MLLKVVVLLLFVLGPPAPAGSERNSRKYFEVEIQDDEYDDGDDESELFGQSPWLAYDQQLRLVGGTCRPDIDAAQLSCWHISLHWPQVDE